MQGGGAITQRPKDGGLKGVASHPVAVAESEVMLRFCNRKPSGLALSCQMDIIFNFLEKRFLFFTFYNNLELIKYYWEPFFKGFCSF